MNHSMFLARNKM